MAVKNQRYSQEQRIALLQECISSGLKARDYAALKNIGYSTLTRWASQLGISLAKIPSSHSNETPSVKTSPKHNQGEGFSFINLTDQLKEANPTFNPSSFPNQPPQGDSCGLEIQMPNGVVLKVKQVPFHALWPQVVDFVRTLA